MGQKILFNGLMFHFSPLYVCILPKYCIELEINFDFSYFATTFYVPEEKLHVYEL